MDKKRISVIYNIFLFILILFLIRLISLQFGDQKKLKNLSFRNKVRSIEINPSRGNIYDRNGVLLVDNQHAYNLYVVPERILSHDYSLNKLSNILEIEKDSLVSLVKNPSIRPDLYLRIRRDIGIAVYSKVVEVSEKLYGVSVKNEWKRHFMKKIAPHVIGYLSEANQPQELKLDISYGDLVGKNGVEYKYDQELRGRKGLRKELRDVKNKKIADYDSSSWVEPRKGKDLYLTIDSRLQEYIENLFKKRSGAVVVLDINNGEVLSLVSKPDFPLDIFNSKMTNDKWNRWLNMEGKPLYSKAVLGEYPPGSVLKMASALAALEQNIVEEKTKICCSGGMQLGKRYQRCWLHSGHGDVDVVSAISMSCDTYFYSIAQTIDINRWFHYLESLGLNNKVGIDLRYERDGFLPDSVYYKKRVRGSLLGHVANIMIGQGEVLTTPLQIAFYTMVLANNGKKYKPHVLHKFGQDSSYVYYHDKDSIQNVTFNKSHRLKVLKGMYDVVNSDWGTASKARSDILVFAGKTGTAQNPHGDDHAWFTSYGPYKNPEIVVTIFQEHGRHGSSLGPLAKLIYEKYYQLKSISVTD